MATMMRQATGGGSYGSVPEVPPNSMYHTVASSLDLNQNLPMAANNTALDVHILLDETGSMASLGNEPEQAVASFIQVQRDGGIPVNISLTKFHLHIMPVFTDLPMEHEDCRMPSYTPTSMTAAYDALRYIILSSTKPLAIVYITDGEDNSSRTTAREIKELIQRAKDCGWTFDFIGCNMESMVESERTGIPSSQPMRDGFPSSLPEMMRAASDTVVSMNRERTA
jgi:hypothetical protein